MNDLTEKLSQPLNSTQLSKKLLSYQEAAKGAFSENTERARKADWQIFDSVV